MIGGIKNMKKFINPEMNMVRFDVENIVTGSTAAFMAEQEVKKNGVTVNGTNYTDVETLTLVF